MKEPFDRWLGLAEAQLDAARKVDPALLAAATEARRRLQDELARYDLAQVAGDDRAYAADVARKIQAIDLRIHACGMAVVGALDAVMPEAGPRTYGRRGQLRGV